MKNLNSFSVSNVRLCFKLKLPELGMFKYIYTLYLMIYVSFINLLASNIKGNLITVITFNGSITNYFSGKLYDKLLVN